MLVRETSESPAAHPGYRMWHSAFARRILRRTASALSRCDHHRYCQQSGAFGRM